MGEPSSLRLSDMRAIFQLVGQCRELRLDSTIWRRHMLVELAGLTGGQVAMGGPAALRGNQLQPDPAPLVDLGWNGERERGVFEQFLQHGVHQHDPSLTSFGKQIASLSRSHNLLTRSRSQLASDRSWYNSQAYCDYRRKSGTDDSMMSVARLPDGQWHAILLCRPPGEKRFSDRDLQLLNLFHDELRPYLQTELAPPESNPVSSLTPRLREVLDCLLEGEAEKQTALRLGLSPQTVNQYVKAIYRSLKVHSRAELMALVLRNPFTR
ncbi:helix-turn-helix transcriptional regulator [Bythopirellula goksoeyrii]|uniref:Response regulator FixJ n=1 Tax=Bythopirellula goksoeyrii TaxID=1400387 RepID=A0A5B9QQ48_9BACT|nr:helix-turn-helix transcriptional regulator [Bythopirellula goksoeyrii]QEG36093.1 response regulator FixJ [Bythopirellula goksoeyrii]